MSNQKENEKNQQITIIGPLSGGSRATKRDIVERTLDVVQVRENFSRFLEGLKAIVGVKAPSVGDFELEEIQFSAEISADGEFKLMGTGVGLEATSGVTFTLRRKIGVDKTSSHSTG